MAYFIFVTIQHFLNTKTDTHTIKETSQKNIMVILTDV